MASRARGQVDHPLLMFGAVGPAQLEGGRQ